MMLENITPVSIEWEGVMKKNIPGHYCLNQEGCRNSIIAVLRKVLKHKIPYQDGERGDDDPDNPDSCKLWKALV